MLLEAGLAAGGEPAAAFFNAVAPVCLLTWLVSSVFIAGGLLTGAFLIAALAPAPAAV